MAAPLDQAFAALSDATRRDLVARLAIGDATVGELAAPYDMSIQAVSKHIQVLAEAGYAVVACNPRGAAGYGEEHARAIQGDFGNLKELLPKHDFFKEPPGLGSYGTTIERGTP